MAFEDWNSALLALAGRVAPVTQEQRVVAQAIGFELSEAIPTLVAAVLLRERLADSLGVSRGYPASEWRVARLRSLAAEIGESVPEEFATDDLVKAWIYTLYFKRSISSLASLQISKGDLVADVSDTDDSCELVASISGDGRINFLGGQGRGAYGHRLRVVARSDDRSARAEHFRKQVTNRIALRRRRQDVSALKLQELDRYAVRDIVDLDQVVQLEEAVAASADERPLQALLAQIPGLLAQLVGQGHDRFVIPKPGLSIHYVPDFLIANVDSAGIHWTLVELESPTTPLTLSSGGEFSQAVRHGIQQIRTWREWLTQNIAHAQLSKSRMGLGLPDIRPEAPGVVLAGRTPEEQERSSRLRQRLAQESQITVHTYDWLIRATRRSLINPTPFGALELPDGGS